jgi:hypothetical protein
VNRRCWMESFESADVQPARTLPRRRIRSQRSAIDLYTRRPATTAFRSLSDRHLLLLIETARNAALARDRRNVVGYGAAAPRPQQIRRTTGVPALVRSECNPVPLEANLNAISGVADGIRTHNNRNHKATVSSLRPKKSTSYGADGRRKTCKKRE